MENDGPPIPTVKELDPTGKMTITFSQPIEIWENYGDLKDEEVAFRSAESRTETYLTEFGY